jgi:hypothetical protein
MKIQILNNIEDCIDGYNPVILDDTSLNIDAPENSISEILMINAIENISYNNLDNILITIRKLLRLKGTLSINGVDVNCISRDLINRSIDAKTYNEVIFSKSAIYDSKELCDKLIGLGLSIAKVSLKGSTYEIKAIRLQ